MTHAHLIRKLQRANAPVPDSLREAANEQRRTAREWRQKRRQYMATTSKEIPMHPLDKRWRKGISLLTCRDPAHHPQHKETI